MFSVNIVYEVLLLIPVKRIPRRLWRSFPSILCTAFMIYFWTVEFPALIAISTLPALQHAPKYTREEVIYNGWTPLAVKDAQGDLIDASYIQISPMRKKWMIFFPGNLMTYASNRSREALVDIANNLETNLAAVNYGRRVRYILYLSFQISRLDFRKHSYFDFCFFVMFSLILPRISIQAPRGSLMTGEESWKK